LGDLALDQGDVEAGRTLLEESLTVSRELGGKCGIARALYHLGKMALNRGEWSAAFARYAESLAIWRQLGKQQNIAEGLEGLGAVCDRQKQPEQAARLLRAAEELRGTRTFPSPLVHRGGPVCWIASSFVDGEPPAGSGKARMSIEQLIAETLELEVHL